MSMTLDNGAVVRFGQDIAEIEDFCSTKAVPHASPVAREGVDMVVRAGSATLDFDSGRLVRINFEAGCQFLNPLTPYEEPWKNFPSIGLQKISDLMHWDDFLRYMAAWEERAIQLGAEKAEFGDLTAAQFSTASDQNEFCDFAGANFGPTRRTSAGGIWCDGWTAFFTVKCDRLDNPPRVGRLESLSAFCDIFNTIARKPGFQPPL